MGHENKTTLTDDGHLICRAIQGDLDSFNQLVLLYQDLAYRHARSLLIDHAAAEDVTQESFLKAYLKIKQFRGYSFRAWLLKIVTNTAYDLLRSFKRNSTTPLLPEDEMGNEWESPSWLADPSPTVETLIEQDELARYLNHILEELPSIYRNVIILIDQYDFDYPEAAEALGIPVGTVKSRLARARYRLKELLQIHSVQQGKISLFDPIATA